MKQVLKYTIIIIALSIGLTTFAQTPQVENIDATYEQIYQQRIALQRAQIDSLRPLTKGYPVIGVMNDTLFKIYSRSGTLTPPERANRISHRIKELYDIDFLNTDSIMVSKEESSFDIIYGGVIVMSITATDALWYDKPLEKLADEFKNTIQKSLLFAQSENRSTTILYRVGLVVLVIFIASMILLLFKRGMRKIGAYITSKKEILLKNLSYKDYTFLSAEQELQIIFTLIRITKWIVYALFFYITIPAIFSIFPFSRTWSKVLINLIYSPLKSIVTSSIGYLPNLITIVVIYFVMRYFSKLLKYVFSEIESEKLKITGFHADWAMPTYSIVRFLLYAFMFVLIFPYLPGSESNIFKGVSVFIGILFSLGSSSAIANAVAGLVITYMRPFKIGDRIKIGEEIGDVIEKTLLVTRIKTVKNEIITIPNSSILAGNTTNYSSEADNQGLIIHTTITIGYDVPWKDMHQALIDAALRTNMILHNPMPFVLQTSLDDFYVSYQINCFIKEVNYIASIKSHLHQNIQDVCNERGIEIMSPHYKAARDGNTTTIPSSYLNKDYKAPAFHVKVEKEE